MRTARRYLASEIYRSTIAVLLVLLALFMFFDMIDNLDSISSNFPFLTLMLIEGMQVPSRLYDLLPISLLIGAIISLASLAQRNELVILRISGVSSLNLLSMLWLITIPIAICAFLLSEYLTPYAEIKTNEINVSLLNKTTNDTLISGYWFREPDQTHGLRVINIARITSANDIEGITIYTTDKASGQLKQIIHAPKGHFDDNKMYLQDSSIETINIDFNSDLTGDTAPTTAAARIEKQDEFVIDTSLTPSRLTASQLQPDHMSISNLLDYIQYLHANDLQTNRQIIALWRKGVYPFTLFIMITLAAPIGFVQMRKGGVGAKIFLGILLGVCFFMVNQLALNVGMLSNLPPWVTSLMPNTIALFAALSALYYIESQNKSTKAYYHAKKTS